MINELTNGIAAALHEEFGDRYSIYTEDVEQGLREPCFLVACVSPKSSLFLGRRHYKENLFLVQYFPESREEPRRECMEAQDRLYDALEWITAGGRPRNGTGMEGECADGILHFQVSYNFFVEKTEVGEFMETLTQKTEARP